MATEAPSLQKTTLTANLREPQRWVAFAVGNSVSPCERLEYAAEGFAGAFCHADIVREVGREVADIFQRPPACGIVRSARPSMMACARHGATARQAASPGCIDQILVPAPLAKEK